MGLVPVGQAEVELELDGASLGNVEVVPSDETLELTKRTGLEVTEQLQINHPTDLSNLEAGYYRNITNNISQPKFKIEVNGETQDTVSSFDDETVTVDVEVGLEEVEVGESASVGSHRGTSAISPGDGMGEFWETAEIIEGTISTRSSDGFLDNGADGNVRITNGGGNTIFSESYSPYGDTESDEISISDVPGIGYMYANHSGRGSTSISISATVRREAPVVQDTTVDLK